jgi:hypothetical protein
VNLGRPAAAFRTACEAQGVRVGRDFLPHEKTHCRISPGTMDEMKRATVFRKIRHHQHVRAPVTAAMMTIDALLSGG